MLSTKGGGGIPSGESVSRSGVGMWAQEGLKLGYSCLKKPSQKLSDSVVKPGLGRAPVKKELASWNSEVTAFSKVLKNSLSLGLGVWSGVGGKIGAGKGGCPLVRGGGTAGKMRRR